MTDKSTVCRRQQLQDAVKRALVDLFASERPQEEWSFPIDSTGKVWVTVRIGAAPASGS